MATKTYDATDGVIASTDANWVGGVKPVAGDDVVFDGTAGADNCTWDLAITLGNFSLSAGYSGTVTLSVNMGAADVNINAGTLNGGNKIMTLSGSMTKGAGGTYTSATISLVMTGTGKTLSYMGPATITKLTITGSVTTASNILQSQDISGTLTITGGETISARAYSTSTYSNTGIINGTGIWNFIFADIDKTMTFGVINCPVTLTLTGAVARTVTLAAAVAFGSTLSIAGTGAVTLTLDLSASNFALSATVITMAVLGILNGRGSIITCAGTFDSSAGAFTQGTSTLICSATGNLKCAADGVYNLRIAQGVTTTLTAALNVYKNLRNMGTLTRGANTVSLLGAGEQTVSGYPDTAITVNSTGPVIFHECLHHPADTTFTAGTCVWTGFSQYITRGNLSISAISRKPHPGSNVQNVSGTLTFDAESRMHDLVTDVGCTTVQSAGVKLGISGKISTAGTFTRNTPLFIIRDQNQALLIPFPVNLPVNQPVGWGDS